MTDPTPQVEASVIIPCRNEAGCITQVLEDLARQDFSGSFEVIVADGESQDETWEELQQFQLQGRYPYRLVLLRNSDRCTPHALNMAVRNARGRLIIRVDAHARVGVDYVRKMVEALRTEGIDVAGPQYRAIPGDQTATARAIVLVMRSRLGNGGTECRTRLSGPVRTEHSVVSSYKKEVWEKIGGYDNYFLRNEDFEFDYRAHRSGFRVYALPQPWYDAYARKTLGALARQRW